MLRGTLLLFFLLFLGSAFGQSSAIVKIGKDGKDGINGMDGQDGADAIADLDSLVTLDYDVPSLTLTATLQSGQTVTTLIPISTGSGADLDSLTAIDVNPTGLITVTLQSGQTETAQITFPTDNNDIDYISNMSPNVALNRIDVTGVGNAFNGSIDLSNLIYADTFANGLNLTGTTLTITRNLGADLTADLSTLQDGVVTAIAVTGTTTKTITLTRSNGLPDLTATFTDDAGDGVVSNVVYDSGTNVVTFTGANGGFNGTLDLSDLSNTDTFATNLTFTGTTLTVERNLGADLTVDLAGLQDGVVTAMTITGAATKTVTLTRSNGLPDITATFSDLSGAGADGVITTVAFSDATDIMTFTGANGGFNGTVDLSDLSNTDTFATALNFTGSTLTVERNLGADLTVDLSGLTDGVVTSIAVTGTTTKTITLTRSNGLPDLTATFTDDNDNTDGVVSNVIYSDVTDIVTFTGANGGFNGTIDLSSLENTDTFVNALTFAGTTLTIERNLGTDLTIDLAGLQDGNDIDYISSITYNNALNRLEVTGTGNAFTGNITLPIYPDTFGIGLSLAGTILTLDRNLGADLTQDLAGLQDGNDIDYISSIAWNDGSSQLEFTGIGNGFNSNITLPIYPDTFANSLTLASDILTIGRNLGADLTQDLSQYANLNDFNIAAQSGLPIAVNTDGQTFSITGSGGITTSSNASNIITIDGSGIEVPTVYPDTFAIGLDLNGVSNILTLDMNTGSDFTADLSQYAIFVNNATLSGNILTFAYSGSAATFNVDLSPLVSPDQSATNELNQTFQIQGSNLAITDAGGTLTVPLADINEANVFEQAGTPTAEYVGDKWYDTDDRIWFIWNGTAWKRTSNISTVAASAPVTDTETLVGDIWKNTLDDFTYTYLDNGGTLAWVKIDNDDAGATAAIITTSIGSLVTTGAGYYQKIGKIISVQIVNSVETDNMGAISMLTSNLPYPIKSGTFPSGHALLSPQGAPILSISPSNITTNSWAYLFQGEPNTVYTVSQRISYETD